MIRIISKKDGFRRCGIAHAKAPVEYPNARFTADEILALRADPMLEVTIVDDGDTDKTKKNPAASSTDIKDGVK